MSEHPDKPVIGVEEAANPRVTPPVLHARPVEGPVDYDKLIDDIRARFPKTLARLAE